MSFRNPDNFPQQWRTINRQSAYARSNVSIPAAGTYMLQSGAGSINAQNAAQAQMGAFFLDPDEFELSGFETEMRIRAGLFVNDTAPGITVTLGLYPVGNPTGGLNVLNPNFGAVIAGTQIQFITPAANTKINPPLSTPVFECPPAGYYSFGLLASGTMAVNSVFTIPCLLEVHNVPG